MTVEPTLRGSVVGIPTAPAGGEVEVLLELQSSAASVDAVEASLHGLAGARFALPGGRAVLRPGMRRQVLGRLRLPADLPPGHYDLALELRCHLDVDVAAVVPLPVEVVPGIDATLGLGPARRRGSVNRLLVTIANPGEDELRVALTAAGTGMRFRFEPPVVAVPPGGVATSRLTVRVSERRARLTVTAANGTALVQRTVEVRGRRKASGAFLVLLAVAALGAAAADAGSRGGTSRTLLVGEAFGGGGRAGDGERGAGAGAGDGGGEAADDEVPGGGDPAVDVAPGDAVDGSADDVALAPGAPLVSTTTTAPPTLDPTDPADEAAAPVACDPTADAYALRGKVVADVAASVTVATADEGHRVLTTVPVAADGTFGVCGLGPGEYDVVATADGYLRLLRPTDLVGTGVDLGTLRLQPGGATLEGLVRAAGGPVPDALVLVTLDGVEVAWARTGDDGGYAVAGVPVPADLSLTVEAVGYLPVSREVAVRVVDTLPQSPVTLVLGR